MVSTLTYQSTCGLFKPTVLWWLHSQFFYFKRLFLKNLFLLRHANAINDNEDDFNRPLSEEGITECQKAAEILKEYINDVDLILCSSALRTQQTIQNILANLKIDNIEINYSDELYHASVNQLFQYIRELDNKYRNILLVNHNPAISHLAIFLTNENSLLYSDILQGFDPANIALYQASIESWSNLEPSNIELKTFWQ